MDPHDLVRDRDAQAALVAEGHELLPRRPAAFASEIGRVVDENHVALESPLEDGCELGAERRIELTAGAHAAGVVRVEPEQARLGKLVQALWQVLSTFPFGESILFAKFERGA